MGKGHGADSKPHISAALSSRPFPTSLRDFPIPPPRKSIDILPAVVTRQDSVSLQQRQYGNGYNVVSVCR